MWELTRVVPFVVTVLATHDDPSTLPWLTAGKDGWENREVQRLRRLITIDPDQELTDDNRQAIVDIHNWWRNISAAGGLIGGKKARSMPKMYWDDELEEHAKDYSRNCLWGHSEDTEYNTLPYDYGENNYAVEFAYMDTSEFEHAINVFGDEVDDDEYNYDVETGLPATHYGQVVWEASVRVGCGVTRCYDGNIVGLGYEGSFMVCQYYIQGNDYGEYGGDDELIPYQYTVDNEVTGVACSEGVYGNSTGMDSTYTALCNNVNSICDDDNRCPSVGSCIPGGDLNGEYTSYSCEPGVCDYVEYAGHEINIAFGQDNHITYCEDDLQLCQNECYEMKDDDEPCVGVTTGEHLGLTSDSLGYWTVHAYDSEDYLDEADGFYYELLCQCTEYTYWSEDVAEENCAESSWGSTDRGYGSAAACDSDLQDRLEESMANGLYESCSSWCIYDLQDEGASAFIWTSSGCWEAVTSYTCYTGSNVAVQEAQAVIAGRICSLGSVGSKRKSDGGTTAAVMIVLLLLLLCVMVLLYYIGFFVWVGTPGEDRCQVGEEGAKRWPIHLDWSVCFWHHANLTPVGNGTEAAPRTSNSSEEQLPTRDSFRSEQMKKDWSTLNR